MLTRTSLGANASEFSSIVSDGKFSGANAQSIAHDRGIETLTRLLTDTRAHAGSVYIIGNGGSAAVASHAVTDFFNVGGLRAMTLHDSSTLTCFSNDYGYEYAFSRRVERLMTKHDVLIAISSSGQSANIRNACEAARKRAATVVTLSGFKADNPLRGMGDINYWLDSDDYGMVEIGHLFLLHYVADLLAMDWSEEDHG
ncbi:MAG: SIS domain-containing protein [Gammaproteobacteria bacterium]|nr:SIS domain-containing protein [Gammaproteobacteria bacterium]